VTLFFSFSFLQKQLFPEILALLHFLLIWQNIGFTHRAFVLNYFVLTSFVSFIFIFFLAIKQSFVSYYSKTCHNFIFLLAE